MIAPARGPTIHTYQLSHAPAASAGPNQRAGFIAAPVYGPNAMMSKAITRPIVRPAVLENGPRSSTAVPNTAKTKKNVMTASRTMPLPAAKPSASAGVPPPPASNSCVGTRYFRRNAPATAPMSSAPIRMRARGDSILPATHRPIVTAGFTSPPEMWAVIETMIASTSPCARATPVRSSPRLVAMTAPAPMKIRAKVETNSATAALPLLSMRVPPAREGCTDDRPGARPAQRLTGTALRPVDRMRAVRVLLVSPDVSARDLMRGAVGSLERRLGEPLSFLDAPDGEKGAALGLRERPDAVVAEEIASRAGGFSLARDLRGASEPYLGPIVLLLERRQDAWLARWSGADAWFVKPVDPFELADRLVELMSRTEKETA